MRYRHYLQPLKANKWPARILLVDCIGKWIGDEKDNVQCEQLASWHIQKVVHSDNGYRSGSSMCGQLAKSFWDLLRAELTETTYTWLISYNCGRIWSLLDVWNRIESGEIKVIGKDHRVVTQKNNRQRKRSNGYLVIQCPPAIMRFHMRNCACPAQWVDVENYGVTEGENIKPGKETTDWLAQWIDEIASLFDCYQLGSLQATAGSQALTAWKTSYYHRGVYVHTDRDGLQLEQAGLHGGRCECYYIGTIRGRAYHLDFRSLYPSLCISEQQGLRLRCVDASSHRILSANGSNYRHVLAEVGIETDEPAYPFRREKDIIYPVGRFRTVLCGPELQDAIDHNRVKHVYRANYYDLGQPLKDYAIALYYMRCRAEQMETPGISAVVKRLLVGLPGKFSQRDRRWIERPDKSSQVPYGEWRDFAIDSHHNRWRSIAWHVQQELVLGFTADAVPSITAWIMAAGRMKLLEAIRITGWDHIYYCDTDSIITDETGYQRLVEQNMVRNKELGYLYIKSVSDNCEIIGVKTYIENDKIVAAGIPHDLSAIKQMYGTYWRNATVLDAVRSGHVPCSARIRSHIDSRTEYRGRIVNTCGHTEPIRIDQCK
jgi:hypothetical protein